MELLEFLEADFNISEASGQIVIGSEGKGRNLTTKEIFSALLTLQSLANDDIREFKEVLREADEKARRLNDRLESLQAETEQLKAEKIKP